MKFFKPIDMEYSHYGDSLTLWGAPSTLAKIQKALKTEPVEITIREGPCKILIYLFNGIDSVKLDGNKLAFDGFNPGSLEIMIRVSKRKRMK